MKKLELSQRKIIADFLSNVAVAWFTAGVISPLFIKQNSISDFLGRFMLSLLMMTGFIIASLFFSKKRL